MDLRLLGPIELRAGATIDIGPAKRQVVLAVMAVDAGRPVTIDTLIDRVWDGHASAPAGARSVLYAHLSRLRTLLAMTGDLRVERRSAGYVLRSGPGSVDLAVFAELVELARNQDGDQRIRLLRRALDLWRGPALAGIEGAWALRTRQRLDRLRVDATVDWAEAELALGHAGAVVADLQFLAVEHPVAEHLIAVLILALHELGRDGEALQFFAETSRQLAEELGVDPGDRLRQAHALVLRSTTSTRAASVPAQLPRAVTGFVGRDAELARLDALVPAQSEPGSVVVATVSGMAGAGKTSFAVYWAHRVASRFDGQLYLDLRGFDDGAGAVAPSDALRRLLDALGVDGPVRADVQEQAAHFRSAATGRRLLILLDNARDEDHVRHLLPGAAGCMVLITSRDQLSDLVVTEGATPLELPMLSVAEAEEMLARRLGVGRVLGEPEAVRQIVSRCGQLPLALAMVAGRSATRPAFSLASIAAELDDVGDGPGLLFAGGGRDLRIVFSWSYHRLTAPVATLFALLGLHPAGAFSTLAAADLAGVSTPAGRQALAELCRANLLTESAPGRFRMHDLLRAYAAELISAADRTSECERATDRLLGHYVRTSRVASLLVNPNREPITRAEPEQSSERLTDYRDAMVWFDDSVRTLLTLVRHAVDTGRDDVTGPLAWATSTYLERRGRWSDQAEVHELAIVSARRLGDRVAELAARRSVAAAYLLLGRFSSSAEQNLVALELAEQVGDQTALAHVLYGLAAMYTAEERPSEALDYARRALDRFRAVGLVSGQSRSLNAIGWQLVQLGDAAAAIVSCREALALQVATGDRYSESETWDTLGMAQHRLGRDSDALASYRAALTLCVDFGDSFREAETLVHLGEVQLALGAPDACRADWLRAAGILAELGHRGVLDLRARLARLPA